MLVFFYVNYHAELWVHVLCWAQISWLCIQNDSWFNVALWWDTNQHISGMLRLCPNWWAQKIHVLTTLSVSDCFDKFLTFMSFPMTFSAHLFMKFQNTRIAAERFHSLVVQSNMRQHNTLSWNENHNKPPTAKHTIYLTYFIMNIFDNFFNDACPLVIHLVIHLLFAITFSCYFCIMFNQLN